MKRVCLLHHTGVWGGGTKSLLDIIEMLVPVYDVTVCIPKGANELPRSIEKLGAAVKEITVPFPCLPRYSGSFSYFSFAYMKSVVSRRPENYEKFCEEVLSCKPDAIIYNTIITTVSAPYFPGNITKMCFVRETIVEQRSRMIFRRILEDNMDKVFFLAQKEAEKMKLCKAESVIIPDCMPASAINIIEIKKARTIEKLPQDKYLILYMGGHDIVKGVLTVLKAINLLDDDYKLLLAGYFSEDLLRIKHILRRCYSIVNVINTIRIRYYYRKAVKHDKIIKLGYVKNISNIMSACDVLVFPSYYVHQPRPCIEAGYYKKPVIISDFDETSEFFIDQYNALTFPPHDASQLAEKIRFAKSNPDLLRKIGENNYTMSKSMHDFEKIRNLLKDNMMDAIGK